MSCYGKREALENKFRKVTNKLKPNLKRRANASSPEKEERENDVLAQIENFAFYYDGSSTSSDSSDETSGDEESFGSSTSSDSSDETSGDEESFGPVKLSRREQIRGKHQIMDKVKPYIGKRILVWCPEAVLPADYVATLLNEYGEVEEVLNRWVPQNQFSTQAAFGGMVVQYKTRDMAMNAVRELHLRSRFVQSILLTTILDYLAKAEVFHPQFGKNVTCLIIKSTLHMDDGRYEHLRNFLSSIGEVNDITDERGGENSTICKAWFVYASQAYIAMLLLNGRKFYLTPLKVSVRKTTKENEILKEIKQKISMYMERNYLP